MHAGTTKVIVCRPLARMRLGMQPHVLFVSLALFTAVLTGCVGDQSNEADASAIQGASTVDKAEGASNADLPPKPARAPLDISAAVSQPWARPGDTVTLTATSAKATTYAWFLQLRPAPAAAAPAAAPTGGHSGHLSSDEIVPAPARGPGHGSNPEPTAPKPQPNLNTGNIEAGQSKPLTFKEEGLYQLHCHPHPWMKVNVTVQQGAPVGEHAITILDGRAQSEYRYAPEDLVVGPGAKVNFVNNGAQMHTATQEAYLEIIPGAGKSLTFAPKNAGDYNVVVIARDGGSGVGVAKTRLFVDPTKPQEKQPIGPYSGELEKGAPNLPEEQQDKATHTFTSAFPFKTLKLSFTSASNLPGGAVPAPTSIKVSLAPEGGDVLGTSEPGASGELSFDALPAGSYVLTVIADTGVMIGYNVEGEALLDLQLSEGGAVQDESQPHAH